MSILTSFAVSLAAVLLQSAPFVILGYLAAALLREFLGAETLRGRFGQRGLGPVLRAVGVGTLLPLCSCSVVPLGVGLRRGGAGLGTVLALMVAGPATSPVALIFAWHALGPALTLAWTAIVLCTAVGLGLLANALARTGEMAPTAPDAAVTPRSLGGRVAAAGRWAFWDLGADVSVDLVIGLVIAAALLALVPPAWIASGLGAQGVGSVLVALVVAIPAYTCTVPTIPVVRSLLLMGASPGAALALLIAGPATNLGELNVLRAQLGGRAAGAFVAALLLAGLLGGWVVDRLLFPGYRYEAFEAAGELVVASCCVPLPLGGNEPAPSAALAAIPAWHYPCAALLATTLLVGLARRARSLLGRAAPSPQHAPAPVARSRA